MIVSILKIVVTIIVAIVVLLVEGAKKLGVLLSDLAAQAKEATPGTVATLKEQAGVATVTGSNMAAKGFEDLRKVIKLPERKAS